MMSTNRREREGIHHDPEKTLEPASFDRFNTRKPPAPVGEWRDVTPESFDLLKRGDNFRLRSDCCGLTFKCTFIRSLEDDEESVADVDVPTTCVYAVLEPVNDYSDESYIPKLSSIVVPEDESFGEEPVVLVEDAGGWDVHAIDSVSEEVR